MLLRNIAYFFSSTGTRNQATRVLGQFLLLRDPGFSLQKQNAKIKAWTGIVTQISNWSVTNDTGNRRSESTYQLADISTGNFLYVYNGPVVSTAIRTIDD